jgi:predicted DNA-binding transcriptional regulator YafY
VARTLDPLGLVAKAGVWYLVAAHTGHVRTYRVGRIASADVLDAPAHRPGGFDLPAYWAASAAEFDRALRTFACTVRLTPAAWRRLPRVVGADAAAVEPGPPDADGRVRVDLLLETEEVALDQLLALGGGVEVVAPRSLRAALRGAGETLARCNS